MNKRKKTGPKPDPKIDRRIKIMVEKKGLSFRQIGKIEGQHHSSIHQRYRRIKNSEAVEK